MTEPFDAQSFVKNGFRVMPAANGGIILHGELASTGYERGTSDRVAFTSPEEFVKWLSAAYANVQINDATKRQAKTMAVLGQRPAGEDHQGKTELERLQELHSRLERECGLSSSYDQQAPVNKLLHPNTGLAGW